MSCSDAQHQFLPPPLRTEIENVMDAVVRIQRAARRRIARTRALRERSVFRRAAMAAVRERELATFS